MSRIQVFPQQLLQLLGLNTSGVPPQELTGVVTPTIDLEALYLTDRQVIRLGTNTVAAAPGDGVTSLTVPANEFWVVQSVAFRYQLLTLSPQYLPLARLIRAGLSYDLPIVTGSPSPGGSWALAIPNSFHAFSWEPPQKMLLRPGDGLFVGCSGLVGGTITINATALVSVLSTA